MRDGFSVADMTPRIGGPGGADGGMTPHIPDLELGAVGGKGGYERVRADERG